jgi:hypothetical protein
MRLTFNPTDNPSLFSASNDFSVFIFTLQQPSTHLENFHFFFPKQKSFLKILKPFENFRSDPFSKLKIVRIWSVKWWLLPPTYDADRKIEWKPESDVREKEIPKGNLRNS